MNQRNRNARLLTGGIIGVPPVTTPGDEHWHDVVLLLDGSSLTDDLSTAENDLTAYTNTTVSGSSAVTLGTTNGTTVAHPYGTPVTYLDFNGDDGLSVPTTFDLSGGDWTFECWVRFNSISQFQAIFSSAVGGIQLGLTANPSPFKLQFDLSGQTPVLRSTTTFSQNTWYHVALTYVGSSQTMSIFVNGSLENSNSNSIWSTITDQYLGGPNHSVSNHVVVLGVNRSKLFPLDGQLTDVRFTRGIARHTANFTPPAASLPPNAPIVGRRGVGVYDTGDKYWDEVELLLDGSSLTDDLSDARNDLSAYSNATVGGSSPVTLGTTNGTTVPHPYGNSGVPYLDFNGDDGLKVPSTFDVSGGDWTFECWARIETGATTFDSIFSTAASGGIQLYYEATAQTLKFDKSSGTSLTHNSNSFSLGQWHHVALTFDYSASTLTMFIDGIGVSSANSNWVSQIDAYLDASQHNLVFGVNRDNASPLDGQLTDIRFTKGVIRYTSSFDPPEASLPTALAGTPEATATLRTRGCIGTAPAGGGMLTLYDRYADTLS